MDGPTTLLPVTFVGVSGKLPLDHLIEADDGNPELHNLIDWAQKVEGRMKSVGTHACGVVISRDPLENIVPLQHTTKDENAVMAAEGGASWLTVQRPPETPTTAASVPAVL